MWCAAPLALLDEIPGVDWTLAAVIIAELGVDMSVFGGVSQVAFWAGVCPGNNESAGNPKSSRISTGNVYLKTAAVVEAADAAARAKGTYLRHKFFRLKARRGYKRAVTEFTTRAAYGCETRKAVIFGRVDRRQNGSISAAI